jgi:hypothetical protein
MISMIIHAYRERKFTARNSRSILVLLVQNLAFCKGSPLFRSLQVFVHVCTLRPVMKNPLFALLLFLLQV